MQILGRAPIKLDARPKSVQIAAVAGLRIDEEFLLRPARRRDKAKARSPFGPFGNGSIDFIPQTIIEHQTIRYLPRVLKIKTAGVAINGSRADVLAIRKI